jgi:tRNA threonylcarbamoyladenosine biosynthesis protein TsaB
LREALLTVDEVVAASSESGGVAVACEAKVAEELPGLRLRLVPEPLAGDALPLALERIERGEFDDAMTLDANYLRQTDTEILAKMKLGRV